MVSRLGVIQAPLLDEDRSHNGRPNGNGRHHRSNGNGNGLAAVIAPLHAPREVDMARVEAAVREMLIGLGENPDREGLVDTPSRVARAYREILAGMHEDPGTHLVRQFSQEQTGDDLVILRDIDFVSVCEHHFLPFTGKAHVAYLPAHGKVTGLSKLVNAKASVGSGRLRFGPLVSVDFGRKEKRTKQNTVNACLHVDISFFTFMTSSFLR